MHAEETKIVSGAQPGHDEPLLGLGGRGFLDHLGDLIQALLAGHKVAPDSPVVRQLAFVGRLHGGYGAFLDPRPFNQLLRGPLLPAAYVQVVAHQQKEGAVADELLRAEHRVSVSQARMSARQTAAGCHALPPPPRRPPGLRG